MFGNFTQQRSQQHQNDEQTVIGSNSSTDNDQSNSIQLPSIGSLIRSLPTAVEPSNSFNIVDSLLSFSTKGYQEESLSIPFPMRSRFNDSPPSIHINNNISSSNEDKSIEFIPQDRDLSSTMASGNPLKTSSTVPTKGPLPKDYPKFCPGIETIKTNDKAEIKISFISKIDSVNVKNRKVLQGSLVSDFLILAEFIKEFAPVLCLLVSHEDDISPVALIIALLLDNSISYRKFLKLLLSPLITLQASKKDFFSLVNKPKIELSSTLPMDDNCIEEILYLYIDRNKEQAEEFLSKRGIVLLDLRSMTWTTELKISILLFIVESWTDNQYLLDHIDTLLYKMPDIKKISRREHTLLRQAQKELVYIRKEINLSKKRTVAETSTDKDDQLESLLKKEQELESMLDFWESARGAELVSLEAVSSLPKINPSTEFSFSVEPLIKQRAFLQNSSIGVDRYGRKYWLFRSFRGLFLESDGEWQVVSKNEIEKHMNLFQDESPEYQLREQLYNLGILSEGVIGVKNELESLEVDVPQDPQIYEVISTLMFELKKVIFTPAINDADNVKYKHFKATFKMIEQQELKIGNVQESAVATFRILINSSETNSNLPIEESLSKAKRKTYLSKSFKEISPLEFCFLDHEGVSEITEDEYIKVSKGLMNWMRILENSNDANNVCFQLNLLLKAISETVDEKEYPEISDEEYSNWKNSVRDQVEEEDSPKGKRRRASKA